MRYGYIGRRLLGGYSTGIRKIEDDILIINSVNLNTGGRSSGDHKRT
jgi:hypothetical protein